MRDLEMFEIISREEKRQKQNVELIASENYVSSEVREAQGSVLTNKYAEGYPGKRYYGGCVYVDQAEELTRQRAKELFGAEHANVQAHSGSQANMSVYNTVLEPGDTVLGMDLTSGGHLTHGHPLNFSGRTYNFIPYNVDPETERIDYDKLEELAMEHHPKLIVAGAFRLPAHHRFRTSWRNREKIRGSAHGRHGAHRRSGCSRSASIAGSLCRFCNDNHA